MRHHAQKEEGFAHLAAEFINTESNRQSLITVTRAQLSSDDRRAEVYFTVLPTQQEDAVMEFLRRKRTEFREFVKKHTKMRIVPTFDFLIDHGERNRQELDTLSNGDSPLE
ncbi:MAG TPA: ribosome-binding factor A [Candidatus Paceibacterota bacterium]|jgi:ribosome-binding factor A|nr:ribosome-binding factor A [Candidatus Paceibacterota bacterium]